MKLKTTIIPIMIMVFFFENSSSLNAQNTVYFQGFESASCPNSDNWGYSGGNIDATYRRTGTNSARIGRSGESNTLTFNSIDVSAYADLVLSVYHSVRGGSGPGMDTREGAVISVSINGAAYTVIGRVGGFSDHNYSWAAQGGSSGVSSGCNVYQTPNPLTYSLPVGTTTIQLRVVSVGRNGSTCAAYNTAMTSGTAYNYDRTDEGFHIDDVNLTTSSVVPSMPGCPLPISLLSFYGYNKEEKGELEWITASEENNLGFEIEKSIDAISFQKIGWVEGNGTTQQYNSYFFTDEYLSSNAYYRLKQIDYDGKFSYSNIILIESSMDWFDIYPIPTQDNLNVKVYIGETSEVEIEVMDLLYKTKTKVSYPLLKGSNQFVLNLVGLESGVYFVNAYNPIWGRKVKTIQVIK